MITTLVVILILATFLLGVIAVLEDIDRLIEDQMLDEIWDDGTDPWWAVEQLEEIDQLPEVLS